MEMSEIKPNLPLDFSLSVKTEGTHSLSMNLKNDGGTVLLSPEKGSSSAFKVVTPKHSDGKTFLL